MAYTPQIVDATSAQSINLPETQAERTYYMIESTAGSGTITMTARPVGATTFAEVVDGVVDLTLGTAFAGYIDGGMAEVLFTPSAGQTYSAGLRY